MTYLDSAILNLTEWSCRRFQLLTGRTNVWLAVQLTNLSIVVYFVSAGAYFLGANLPIRILIALFCGGLFYVLTQTIFKVPIEALENNAYRRVAKGYRNPRRVRDALLRISFLTLTCLIPLAYLPTRLGSPALVAYLNLRMPVFLLTYSLVVLTTVLLYVLACDPLPPCMGKLRVWLRGSAPARLAPSESPRAERIRATVRATPTPHPAFER